MKRIVVVGDLSSTNLGDPLLTHCCKYLVDKVLGDNVAPIVLFDIAGRRPVSAQITSKASSAKVRKDTIIDHIKSDFKPLIKWLVKDKKSFCARLFQIGVDNTVFVIAGGALLSSSLFYALRLHKIVRVAKKNGGKVIFNSVGIEKSIYNFGLAKHVVRDFLKQKAVVAFSTRDHIEDIPYLTKRSEFYKQTPDPGLFASETFNVERKDSAIIGLSVISYQAYRSVIANDKRAEKVTPDYLISYWSSIIGYLQKMNLDYRILTNGSKADYEMAKNLVYALKLDENKYLLPLPQTPYELVNQISMFRMVIAHRLHACIISSSLNIPIIPLIWSDKVKAFAEMIGNQFAMWPEMNEVSVLQQVIEKSLEADINTVSLKDDILNYLNNSLKLCEI